MHMSNLEKAILASLIASVVSGNPVEKRGNPFHDAKLGDPYDLEYGKREDMNMGFSSLESAFDLFGGSSYSNSDYADRVQGVQMKTASSSASKFDLGSIMSGVQSVMGLLASCQPGQGMYCNNGGSSSGGANPYSCNNNCPFATCPSPPGGGSPPGGSPPGGSPPGGYPPTGGSPPPMMPPTGGSPPGGYPPTGGSPPPMPPTGGSSPGGYSPPGGSPPGGSPPGGNNYGGGGYGFWRRNAKPQQLDKRDVYDADDRKEACNTNIEPYAAVGSIGGKNGKVSCTGTLIGPRTVLTAAHCVHAGGTGRTGWLKGEDISFHQYSRNNCNEAPKNLTFEAETAYALKGWTENRDPNFDMAVVVLKTKDTQRGYMSFSTATFAEPTGSKINLNAFASDKDQQTMYHASGVVSDSTKHTLKYDAGTKTGASGAGLYVYNPQNGKRNIIGVHNGAMGEEKKNVGTRIDAVNFHMICDWLDRCGTHIDGCPK